MDLHDRKLINRPMKFLKKLLIWPFWVLKSKDKSFKRFLYDASLHLMDKEIGNLIKNLKKMESLVQLKLSLPLIMVVKCMIVLQEEKMRFLVLGLIKST